MAMLDVVNHYITVEPCDASLGPHAAVGCTREAGDEDVDVARIVLALRFVHLAESLRLRGVRDAQEVMLSPQVRRAEADGRLLRVRAVHHGRLDPDRVNHKLDPPRTP
jgi:hypothetical protein